MTPGKRYRTACVRASLGHISPPEWIPVIGPPHDDTEFIGLAPVHLHIDWRFLNKRQRKLALNFGENAAHDLVVATVYPDDDSGPIELDQALSKSDLPKTAFLKHMSKKYQGPFPPYPEQPPYWLPALSRAYQHASLLPGKICPHRGADLSEAQPDEQGVITCPLHGLRWQAHDGRAATSPTTTARTSA